MSRHGAPNLWFLHLAMPIFASLLIWALSGWQRAEVSRRAFRLTIPLFVFLWAVLLRVEGLAAFSYIGGPIRSVLLVALSCYTLVSNARHSWTPVWRADWFWVSTGLLLSFGARVVLTPISQALLASSPAEILRMYTVFDAIDVVATLLVSWGILCAKRESVSGGSSSPRSRSPAYSLPPS